MAFGLTVAIRTFIIVNKKLKLISIAWSYLVFNGNLLYQNEMQLNESTWINLFYYTPIFVTYFYIILKWEDILNKFIENVTFDNCKDILETLPNDIVVLNSRHKTLFYNPKVGNFLKIKMKHLSKKLVSEKTLSLNNLELLDTSSKQPKAKNVIQSFWIIIHFYRIQIYQLKWFFHNMTL